METLEQIIQRVKGIESVIVEPFEFRLMGKQVVDCERCEDKALKDLFTTYLYKTKEAVRQKKQLHNLTDNVVFLIMKDGLISFPEQDEIERQMVDRVIDTHTLKMLSIQPSQ